MLLRRKPQILPEGEKFSTGYSRQRVVGGYVFGEDRAGTTLGRIPALLPPPYLVRYWFHFFYHPFTRLFWNQLGSGGFDLLYDPSQQIDPNQQLHIQIFRKTRDQVDPSGADKFSFGNNYLPVTSRVNWDHDDVTGEDRQFLDFRYDAAFGVYNWELFYHIPLFIAQLLSQNQQFEDAQKWFHYIFNPTRQATNASTTLAAGITDTQQTSINVVSAGGFPSPYFPVSIGAEVLFVTAVSGSGNTTWTVLRGQQGTTAAAAAVGTTVTLSDLPPQRFWIPKPLHNLTSSQILGAADQQPAGGSQSRRSS